MRYAKSRWINGEIGDDDDDDDDTTWMEPMEEHSEMNKTKIETEKWIQT